MHIVRPEERSLIPAMSKMQKMESDPTKISIFVEKKPQKVAFLTFCTSC